MQRAREATPGAFSLWECGRIAVAAGDWFMHLEPFPAREMRGQVEHHDWHDAGKTRGGVRSVDAASLPVRHGGGGLRSVP
jgi:hypothetical protein